MTDSAALDWMISVDDHVLEPPHVWEDRLPAKYREVGPRLRTDDAGEAWFYEDKRIPTLGLAAAAGRKKEEFSPLPLPYSEMRPGCYDSVARLEDMNQSGVLASMCFPSMGRFCGQSFYEGKDKELSLLCIQAYNDWMIDEWAGRAPGRFIPLIIIPLWDMRLAVGEIERAAAKGAKAIAFSENPVPLGLPSIHHTSRYWEPLFVAASETGLPLCTHFGSSSTVVRTSPDTPMIATIAMNPTSLQLSSIDWLFSGILQRHSNLKICLSEGGIGWIPWMLERADHTQDVQRYWASNAKFEGDLQEGVTAAVKSDPDELQDYAFVPSELFRGHIYGCFIDEPFGASVIETIGVDNVMVESDYPHTDSTWPNSIDVVLKQIAHLSASDQHKVLRGNAERVFNFVAATPPTSRL